MVRVAPRHGRSRWASSTPKLMRTGLTGQGSGCRSPGSTCLRQVWHRLPRMRHSCWTVCGVGSCSAPPSLCWSAPVILESGVFSLSSRSPSFTGSVGRGTTSPPGYAFAGSSCWVLCAGSKSAWSRR